MDIPYEQTSRWIVENFDLWQLDFVNPEGLYQFTKDRGVKFWADHISQLWQIGWLRADLIGSKQDIHLEGVQFISEDPNGYKYYCDNRSIGNPQQDIEHLLRSTGKLPEGIDLYFHPFKFYTLYQIQRVVGNHINPFQIFIQSHYHDMLERDIQGFNRWISSEQLTHLINQWNDIPTLAIATEPCYFLTLFGFLRHSPWVTYEQQLENITRYRSEIRKLYEQIDPEIITQIIRDLCTQAEILDPNKQIHTLLRFLAGRKRAEIKGDIGGAILLKSMAEIIRRMAEFTYEIELPEEDEMGFGLMVPGMKERIYGAKRLFDDQSHIGRQQLIREMGLDPGIRIRWYVEGETEYYVLNSIFSSVPQIEIINLLGHVAQRAGKGIAFRDNLILDERSQIFSIILLDSDKLDNIRVVRRAAEDDIFCGLIYISEQDFEMANFTKDELEEIIWCSADETEKNENNLKSLHEAIAEQNNGGTILNAARRALPSLSQFGKGQEWGEQLVIYGWKHPHFTGTETIRPFIEAINQAIISIDIDFRYNRINYRVDPATGRLIHR